MNYHLKITVICVTILILPCTVWANDKIITNAKVWTGNALQPWATTIIIKDERIVAVGDNELTNRAPDAERINAGGRLVLPGFIDNHTHFMDGSASLISVKTQDAESKEEFVTTIKKYAEGLPKGEWITGGLWDHEKWGGHLPQKDWVDKVTQDNPLFLLRTDGHMAIANSLVLELAGISKDTADPEGGTIVRDANGEPTGVLKDNAMNFVWDIYPEVSEERAAKTFDAGIQEALQNGVTQIHNMSTWDNIAVFKKAKAENRLKIRTYYFPYIASRHKLAAMIKREGKGDNWLRFGGVKELVDGSLGSTTAWFYQPYTDTPNSNGFPLMRMDALKNSLEESLAYGLQLAIHGIGDQANDQILKLFAEIGTQGLRPRIEHAQHLTTDAIKKFKELDVIPSMQPYHAIDDGRWAEKRIGAERLKGTYAFRSLMDTGAMVTFGSDWSVAPLSPILGIYAAVTRRTLDGKNPGGWVPGEKISVAEAVKAYTFNNAWAGFQENDLGTVEAGKLADLVMLSDNIFKIKAAKISDTKVVMTMIGGEVMYSAK